MSAAESFNASSFSRWINHKPGRIFRLCAGAAFVVLGVVGLMSGHRTWGIAALVWSIFPLTAGLFDRCYISGVLGGPWDGSAIRTFQDTVRRRVAR